MTFKETVAYVESQIVKYWPTLIGVNGWEVRPRVSRCEVIFPSFPKEEALRKAKEEKTLVQNILSSKEFKGLDTKPLWNKVDDAAYKLFSEELCWVALCQRTWPDVPFFTSLLKKAYADEVNAGGDEALKIKKREEEEAQWLAKRQAEEARNASRLQWWVLKARRCQARGEQEYVTFLVQQAKKAGIPRVQYIQEQINGKA